MLNINNVAGSALYKLRWGWSDVLISESSSVEWIFSVCNRYVDPAEVGLTDDQLREIPYTHVEYVVCWIVNLFTLKKKIFIYWPIFAADRVRSVINSGFNTV